MVPCNPLDMPWVLGTTTVVTPTATEYVGINDPNVYIMSDGNMGMVVHCSAVGGMLLFTASADAGPCNTGAC